MASRRHHDLAGVGLLAPPAPPAACVGVGTGLPGEEAWSGAQIVVARRGQLILGRPRGGGARSGRRAVGHLLA